MARAAAKTAPAGVSICIVAFSGEAPDGIEYSFSAGARVRSDHPAVVYWDKFFIEDGATDSEINAAR
jgi:hypothetical protein